LGDGHGDEVIALVHLYIPIDARFTIGDGQHRLKAYDDVLHSHEDPHDPVLQRLQASGTPAIIVEEGDPAKTAQDFVDLQRNAKPLSSSLGAAMDRRKAINRLALELAKSIKLLNDGGPGDRIEYLSQTLSKLSPKMYTFASWRFAVGTLVIGFGQRTRKGWEDTADGALAGPKYGEWLNRLHEIFDEAAEKLPGWSQVIAGSATVQNFRQKYVLGAGAGFNAFAGALHGVLELRKSWKDALKRVADVDWLKVSEDGSPVFFEGTIVQQGKVLNNRPAFEAAAQKLFEAITKSKAA
jgi:hypothetical protein